MNHQEIATMTTESLNSGDFRSALGSFATGVTIVTTTAPGGVDVGVTANSFNSVSLDPPMILWSIGKNSLSRPAFAAAEYFAVHILAYDQQSLSSRFSRRGEDKFAGLDLERGPGGVPLLKGCAARFKCRTAYCYEGGDHDIIVGEVIEFDHFDKSPLLFHRGKYSAIATGAAGEAPFASSFLGFMLARAEYALLQPIRRELQRLDINIGQYFALSALGVKKMSMTEIDDLGRLYDCSFDHASALELKRRALVDDAPEDGGTRLQLTPQGRRLMWQLLAIGKDAEATLLEQFEPWEGQWLKGALHRIGGTTRSLAAETRGAN